MRNSFAKSSSYCLILQNLDTLETIRKTECRILRNIEFVNMRTRETPQVLEKGIYLIIPWTSASASTGTQGRTDRGLSYVQPFSSNLHIKSRRILQYTDHGVEHGLYGRHTISVWHFVHSSNKSLQLQHVHSL